MLATVSPQGWMCRGGLVGAGVLTAVVIASVSQPRSGPLAPSCRSHPPVDRVISYGLYLWHWPVIVLMTRPTPGCRAGPSRGHRWEPCWSCNDQLCPRGATHPASPVRGLETVVMAPAGLIATAAAVVAATAVPSSVAAAVAPPATSPRQAAAAAAPAPSTSVMVVGDSTALGLVSGMEAAAGPHGLAVHNATASDCSIAEGSTADDLYGLTRPTAEPPACRWRLTWPRLLQQWRPTVAYLGFGPEDTADHLIDGRWMRVEHPSGRPTTTAS